MRGGASVTALAPLVLALELTDLLRSHAEHLAVVPHARGLARNEPKEHIRLISRVASTVMSAAPSLRWLRLAPDRLPTVVAGVRVGCAASSYDEPSFFCGMLDPLKPGHQMLVPNHRNNFLKQMKYVQRGLLSDPPGMGMYLVVGIHPKTRLLMLRTLRNSSVLEGHFLHYSSAIHPTAKGSKVADTCTCEGTCSILPGR